MGDDQEEEYYDDDGGFEGYVEDTVDPGPWLLIGTCVFCFGVMLVAVPLLVAYTLKQRKHQHDVTEQLLDAKRPVETNFRSLVSFDRETRKIVKLAIPYTVSALASSTLANVCLVLVSQHIGTKAVAAYALVTILVELTDGMIQGPIYACTTLCAHAVGAGNNFLAGQYIQLAIIFYLLFNIPVVYFWWFYMYDVILILEWGDDITAQMSQEFIRVYIWSFILGGIESSVWELLDVTGHAVEGTIMSIVWGITNVVFVGLLVTTQEATLQQVGLVYLGTAVFFIGLTLSIAKCRGWLKPFTKGLFRSMAFTNFSAINLLLKQAVPLAFASLLSNAEWAILTVRIHLLTILLVVNEPLTNLPVPSITTVLCFTPGSC